MLRFLTGIFMLCCIWMSAGAQQLAFNIYTPADGLIDARVQKIFQDSRGILYFLTRDGFCSFDGQRFQNFTQYQNQPLSIVNDIIEEKNGLLLISAFSGMYWLQDNQLQKDTSIFKELKEPGSILPAGPGEWVLLSNTGTFLYSQGKLTPLYTTTAKGLKEPLQFDKAFCYGPSLIGTSLSGTNKDYQLVLYNRLLQKITDTLRSDQPFDMATYNNRLFIKINTQWKQADLAVLNKGQLLLNLMPVTSRRPVENFFIDKQDNYWLFDKDNAVYRVSASSGKLNSYTSSNGLPASVSGIFQDAENNYWFIVNGKGVYKLVQSRIEALQWPGNKPAGIILNMHQSADGTISLREGDTIRTVKQRQFTERIIKVKPGALQTFTWNNKWRVLYNDGQLTTENSTPIRFARFAEGSKQISGHISYDREGRLLTAGDFFAVFAKDTLTTSIPLPYFTDRVIADDNNNYWCFARNGEIMMYTLSGNKLVQKVRYTDNTYSTRYAIHWNKDTFCIGTRNSGVVFVKANSTGYQKLNTINTNDGLSNNFISGLLKINHHELLIATVAGLDQVYFAVDTTVEQLFSRTGLFTGVRTMAQKNDSTVIALADNGEPYLVHLNTDNSNAATPSFFFNRISVNGITIDTSVQQSFNYNQNNFRFAVSAPSFIDEKNIRFILSVNGESKNAAHDSRSGDFELSNLAPGNYTIRITALLPGYNSENKTITYYFHIKKPFWKTAGFIVSLFALAALLIYGIFRNILRKKLERQKIELEKQEAIARERTRIATDMHDDLGAGISTIKYLSQSAPFISAGVQKENNLKIAAQADDLVDKMNDIIWAMNEKNDTLDNLVFYTKAWVANYAEQHNLDATVNIPATVPSTIIRGEKRQHIFLCIKEAVHNIIKHAGATRMWLDIEWKENKLHITIKDNGRGFDGKKASSGNGLANMQKRIQAVNGLLKIESKEGTVLFLTIPV